MVCPRGQNRAQVGMPSGLLVGSTWVPYRYPQCGVDMGLLGSIWVNHGLRWASCSGPMRAKWATLLAPRGAHSWFVHGAKIGPKWACQVGCWWAVCGYHIGTLIGLSMRGCHGLAHVIPELVLCGAYVGP